MIRHSAKRVFFLTYTDHKLQQRIRNDDNSPARKDAATKARFANLETPQVVAP